MPNLWILHIKDFAKNNNLSYSCALTDPRCRATYKSKKDLEKPVSKIIEVIKPLTKKIKVIKPLTKKQGFTISEKERAQNIKDDYMAKVDSSIILTGYKRRGTNNKSKHINTLASEYYKLTGEHLPSTQMIKKDYKKADKQLKKIEEELVRKKALEPVKTVGPITGFRQKKIGFLL